MKTFYEQELLKMRQEFEEREHKIKEGFPIRTSEKLRDNGQKINNN